MSVVAEFLYNELLRDRNNLQNRVNQLEREAREKSLKRAEKRPASDIQYEYVAVTANGDEGVILDGKLVAMPPHVKRRWRDDQGRLVTDFIADCASNEWAQRVANALRKAEEES